MNLLLILLQSFLWDSMPYATIHQDSMVQQLMEDHWLGHSRGETEMPGWRVQIYSSNNQLEAKQEAEELKQYLSSLVTEPIYVDFIQPFWKVRIGNFTTHEAAKAYRDNLIVQFPDLQAESYPVRAQISVKK